MRSICEIFFHNCSCIHFSSLKEKYNFNNYKKPCSVTLMENKNRVSAKTANSEPTFRKKTGQF